MLCIKFNNNGKKANLYDKFCVINEIVNILPTEDKLEIYWSDYSFSKVPESKVFNFIQNTIMNNQAILDDENSNKFITIIVTLKDKKQIQIEITPPKVRVNQSFLPHIEFSFLEEESCLFEYFENSKKLNQLIRVLNKYSKIDETYFYDPLSGLDCYSDVSNRLWQKRNNPKSFTEDLLELMDKNDSKLNGSELEADTVFNLAFNFIGFLYRPDGITKMTNLISQSKLDATASSGSIILSGQDVPQLIKLLEQKMSKYIKTIKKKNFYEKEFNKIFT
jgi:hypothetical protein